MQKTISIIVPVYNEEKNIPLIAVELSDVFSSLPYDHEIIFINDGSEDSSQIEMEKLAALDDKIKAIEFSRNFGKEVATSAGLHRASGAAAVIIDADLQHPTKVIPLFIERWEKGADVVIGLRTKNKSQPMLKALTSSLYYRFINSMGDIPLIAGATDFRLLDRKVMNEFNKLTEHKRIARGLIDWLGFKREFVEFEASERIHGSASYSYLKLIRLAMSSFVSHSTLPLKFAGYLGMFIMTISGIGGLVILIERYIFNDALGWNITGTGQLAVLMIFFIGILLSCLGLVSLYIENIYYEVSARPLYVVRSVRNMKAKQEL